MKKYTLKITASCFGTRQDFYKEFSKNNRLVVIENVEFEGENIDSENPQHNSGYIIEDFETHKTLTDFMQDYLFDNSNLATEYFSIREKGTDNVIFTEEYI